MTERPKLAVLCKMLRNTVDPQKHTTGKVWHYSIPAFDRDRKPFLTVGHEILSSKLLLTEPCILFSRLNPRIPRVWYFSGPPSDLPCVASTEFVPFTVTKPDRLDARYLYWFLHSPEFVRTAQNAVQAATKSRERANKDRLLEARIPLPPLAEQKRIAAVLAKADRVRRLRRYALEVGAGYLQSVFLEMFGDPATNPMGWKVGKLKDLCSKIVDCPHSTPTYSEVATNYACVRSSDIQNGYLDLSTTKFVGEEEYLARCERLVPLSGDIVYCREGARFGNAARLPSQPRICLGQRMMLFRPDAEVTNSEFLWSILDSPHTYKQAVEASGGSASPHVNVADIKMFDVIIPPYEEQRIYGKFVHHFEKLRKLQLEAIRQADHLYEAQLQSAFALGGTKDTLG